MRSIRGKMLVWFGLVLLVLLSILGVVNYIQVRDTVIPLTKELSQEILVARSAEMGRLIKGYLSDVTTMSRRNLIRQGNWNEIRNDLLNRHDIINGDYEMVFFVDSEGHFTTTTGSVGLSTDREYFQAIMEEGKELFISDPLVSRASGEYVFVIASAVINQQGETIGLIAATVLLETLSGIAETITIGEKGFGYLVDRNGLLITHPDEKLRMNLNLLDSAALGFQGLDEVGRTMVRGESGLLSYQRPDGSTLITIFNQIPSTPGWSLGIALDEGELMGMATGLMRNMIGLMVGILVGILILVLFVSGRIASPIRALKDGVKVVSSGNLDHTLSLSTGDETQELAEAFNRMTTDLKEYMRNLQLTTAEKERIQSELLVANKIQSSMLPRTFPPYPNIKNLGLYATMEPAKEVGGDFYDFFLLDDHRFCFTIGDVSGKGIPAALFMVITRTILKNQALQNESAATIFNQTNAMLCSDNAEDMFVTVFMGILDTRTGVLEYVNAGHNPPLLSRNGKGFEFLEVDRNLVMGVLDDYEFNSMTTTLQPGDMLFLYTDGVTEAMNHRNELFTEERLLQQINEWKGKDVHTLVRGIRQEVADFVQDTPASDDVTMLAVTLQTNN